MNLRRATLSILAIIIAGLALGACGSSSSSSATDGENGSIETRLQEDVVAAGKACGETAEAIGIVSARKAAEGGCRSLQAGLEAKVAPAAEAAEGSIESAVTELSGACRTLAAKLSFGKEAALTLCKEIEALR